MCIYMCLPRSLKNPYQTIFAKTVVTQSVYLCAFAWFSQKPLLKFIYEYEHELSCQSMFTYTRYNL